jgi:hypothetical protein
LKEYKSIELPGKLQVQVRFISQLRLLSCTAILITVGRIIRDKFYPLQYMSPCCHNYAPSRLIVIKVENCLVYVVLSLYRMKAEKPMTYANNIKNFK